MNATTIDILRALRERHKLTQVEIAKRSGIPQPRLSRWASGEVPTGADDALKLAELVRQLDAAQEKTV